MRSIQWKLLFACLLGSAAMVQPANAQWAVIDAPALVQLVQQVANAEQQLMTLRNQLVQAQQSLQAMTGARGMDQLLKGTVRNYLPANWSQLTDAMQGSGVFGSLISDAQSISAANAVLSPQRLALMPASAQQLIQASRQWNAMQQAMSHQALSNSSDRFNSLQSLISAIATTTDQKGILELQARISAELAMLQNEQTKLGVLAQSTQGQQAAIAQQTREQVIAGHGRFDTRFQPTL
jgi:type IV secretion system protein VirB5